MYWRLDNTLLVAAPEAMLDWRSAAVLWATDDDSVVDVVVTTVVVAIIDNMTYIQYDVITWSLNELTYTKFRNIAGKYITYVNQVHAGQRLARAWFFEIAFVRNVSMSVCVPPRL